VFAFSSCFSILWILEYFVECNNAFHKQVNSSGSTTVLADFSYELTTPEDGRVRPKLVIE
jgi:hypothetical protein